MVEEQSAGTAVPPQDPADAEGRAQPGDDWSRFEPEVFAAEIERLKLRKGDLGGTQPRGRFSTRLGLVGLAFSGGGIRSATFNLGALQALYDHGVLQRVDYLSTVSGGGYIGSCLQALLADGKGFPFRHVPGVPEGQPLRHLRRYSNYLTPRGLADVPAVPVLVVRGLVTNLLILLPFLLLAVWFVALVWGGAIVAAANAADGTARLWSEGFVVTRVYLGLFLAALALYPVYAYVQSAFRGSSWRSRTRLLRLAGLALIGLLAVALVEVQPLAIDLYGRLLAGLTPSPSQEANAEAQWALQVQASNIADLLGMAAAALGAVTTVLAGLATRFGTRAMGRVKLALFGVVAPLLVWLIFLVLARRATIGPPIELISITGPLAGLLSWLAGWSDWMVGLGTWLGGNPVFIQGTRLEMAAYFYGAVALWALDAVFVDVNKTSLHSYYRDRLSRAYLIRRPDGQRSLLRRVMAKAADSVAELAELVRLKVGREDEPPLEHADTLPLSQLASDRAPYHLVNTAINVPRTRHRTLRGRKSDFFLLSQCLAGSTITGYCETRHLERVHPELNLGTALAISGAAAAPNMGTMTVGPLRMIMTLLNVRLGYWLPNPGRLSWIARHLPAGLSRLHVRVGPVYLFREMFGLIDEDGQQVNVSDGGHIENLGLYELLRRRCRVIIACDAEADPAMKLQGLATAIRLARIDLGVDVEIETEAVRLRESSATSARHCAVGTIRYGNGERGVLLYVKSSVTGDENPYITEYRLRSLQDPKADPFPHETTADQFFDEAQFEAYRALGYHIVKMVLTGRDCQLRDEHGTPLTAQAWSETLGPVRKGMALDAPTATAPPAAPVSGGAPAATTPPVAAARPEGER